MKILSILPLLACFIAECAFGQRNIQIEERGSSPLEISYQKTTSLIFPASIKSVDRGSKDILVAKAKGVENVLLIKAGRHQFSETNLTVITGDGNLHCFTVHYSTSPETLTHQILAGIPVILNYDLFNESIIASATKEILARPRSLKRLNTKKHQVSLSIESIYVEKDVLFYKVRLKNSSNIDYDIDFLRFTIQDRQKLKRTASQEIELKPLFVTPDIDKAITNSEDLMLVFAFQKFTIPDNKLIKMNLHEKNGGRHLNLTLKNKHLMKAQKI